MIDHAVRVLNAGGVVAFATDTLYGLAADPRSAEAVAKLFMVKARDSGHPIPLIAADVAQVEQAAVLTPLGGRLAAAFWPGPLSIILDARSGIVPEILGGDGSIAIRVPASETARQLAREFGYCLTSTSANLSGQPATADPAQVATTVGQRIDYLLDTGRSPGGQPSTIVDARGAAVRLVRAGAVPWERVLESLK